MYNHRGKRKKDGREYGTDFYNCSTYTLTFERETQMCFFHTVSTKALNALILETIRTTDVIELVPDESASTGGKEHERIETKNNRKRN